PASYPGPGAHARSQQNRDRRPPPALSGLRELSALPRGTARPRGNRPRVDAGAAGYAAMIVHVNGALLRFTDYRRVISVDAPTLEAALTRLAHEDRPPHPVPFHRTGQP